MNICSNANLLTNIRKAKHPKVISSHGGTKTVDMEGDLRGYPNHVYYNEEGIANILSLSKVKETFRVTYDSDNGNIFTVNTPHGDIELQECSKGLFYHDTYNSHASTFVTTVAQKKTMYTNRQFIKAKQARKLQSTIEYPSYRTYIDNVENKSIKNCPITRFDVKNAEDIFGPNVDALQGKKTRTKPNMVKPYYLKIPHLIM